MGKYRAYFSTRGYVEVEADSDLEAEAKGFELLFELSRKSSIVTIDDTEVHCAEEVQ
jgi:hypothetical protein